MSEVPLYACLAVGAHEPARALRLCCWIFEILYCNPKGRRALLRIPSTEGRSVACVGRNKKLKDLRDAEALLVSILVFSCSPALLLSRATCRHSSMRPLICVASCTSGFPTCLSKGPTWSPPVLKLERGDWSHTHVAQEYLTHKKTPFPQDFCMVPGKDLL